MTDSTEQTEAPDAVATPVKPLHALSKHTTPTWEIELLISGATVFGLMQLPGPLAVLVQKGVFGNEQEIGSFLLVLGMYLQFSLLTLIATFVLHLLMRGYWVALVGLYSVYPEGIRWGDRKSYGPIYQRSDEGRMLGASAQIEAADNRATKIFGLGFGVALSLVPPSLLVGLFLALLFVVQALNLDASAWFIGFWLLFTVLFLPFLGVYLLDRWRGQQLIDQGRAGPLLKVFNLYARIGMGRGSNPLMALATSQIGSNRGTLYLLLGMMPVMIVISLAMAFRGRDIDNGAFDGLPSYQPSVEHSLHNGHYASLRDPANTNLLLPFLPDPFIKDGTLRLFIPYQPARHTPMMRHACPQALRKEAARRGDGLLCLAKLHAVSIDGQPLQADWLGGRDPGTGQRGIWAMIDVSTQAKGRHELVVQRLTPIRDGKLDEVVPDWRIVYWRQPAGD